MALPDIKTGYTLDDNARALIALCQHFELTKDKNDLPLIDTYLRFINYCIQPSGLFLNYVDEQGQFTQQNYQENLDDSNGRAIWALGYVCSLKDILPITFTNDAGNLLNKVLTQLVNIHSTRAMAFIIKGLHYQNKAENLFMLELFANRLVQMYRHESSEEWNWFESYLTYGNSLLPEAMLCAYLSTDINLYQQIAKESFDFLLSKIVIDGQLKVISNKGWLIKDHTSEIVNGGEQPIDVAYTIITLEKYYQFWNKKEYLYKAKIAFNWFLGQNHLRQIIHNPRTGGCYDGLEEHNININQGAESTVSYFMARLAIEKMIFTSIINSSNEDEVITIPQLEVTDF